MIQTLFIIILGVQVVTPSEEHTVRGILLDVTLDSPAKALWLQMKQFNGYFGCPKCKEEGEQHIIGAGKDGRKRQCHIYPYNNSFAVGHCGLRKHDEVKQQALQALTNRKNGITVGNISAAASLSGRGLSFFSPGFRKSLSF